MPGSRTNAAKAEGAIDARRVLCPHYATRFLSPPRIARGGGKPNRPVRRFLPHLIDVVIERNIEPGKVFYLTLPLTNVAEGYRAMDERFAIKTLLRV